MSMLAETFIKAENYCKMITTGCTKIKPDPVLKTWGMISLLKGECESFHMALMQQEVCPVGLWRM